MKDALQGVPEWVRSWWMRTPEIPPPPPPPIERWECEVPPPGLGFIVVDEEFDFSTDPPVRTIRRVELLG